MEVVAEILNIQQYQGKGLLLVEAGLAENVQICMYSTDNIIIKTAEETRPDTTVTSCKTV